MNPILILSFGYDDCLHNQPEGRPSSYNAILKNNRELIEHLQGKIQHLKESSPKHAQCIVLINSRRQSPTQVDRQCNSDAYQEYEILSKQIGAQIDPFVMGMIFNPHYCGVMFEKTKVERLNAPKAGWITDDSKLSTIYTQIHKSAMDHLGFPITFRFYDGNKKRIKELQGFFSKNPELIPESLSLELIYYNGKFRQDIIMPIQGEGKFINVNYGAMILEVSEKTLMNKRASLLDGQTFIESARRNNYLNLPSISLVYDANESFVKYHNQYHPDMLYRKEIITAAIALYKRKLMDDSFARRKKKKIAGVEEFLVGINLSTSLEDIEDRVRCFLQDDNTQYLAKFKFILSKRWEKAAKLSFVPPRPIALVELGSTPDSGKTIALSLKEKGIVDVYLFIFSNFDEELAKRLHEHVSVFINCGIQIHGVGSFQDLVKSLNGISNLSKLNEVLKLIEPGDKDIIKFNINLSSTKDLLREGKHENPALAEEMEEKLSNLQIFEEYYQNLNVNAPSLGSFIDAYFNMNRPSSDKLFQPLNITRMGLRYQTQLNPEKMLVALFFKNQPNWVTQVVAFGECANLMAEINQQPGNIQISLSPANDASYYKLRLFKLQLKSPVFKIDAELYQELAGKIDAYISKLNRKNYNIFQHNTLSKVKALEDLKQMLAVPLQSDKTVRDILIRWENTVLYQDKKKEPVSMGHIINDTRKKHMIATRSPLMEAHTKTQVFINQLRFDYGKRCLSSERYVPAVLSPKVF